MIRASSLAALLLSSIAACTPDFDSVWDVSDLRLLGIRAEPPEVLLPFESITPAVTFPTVRVDALVVDPRDPDQTLRWQAFACTPEESRCEDAVLSKRIYPSADGAEQWASTRLDEVAFDFTLDAELAFAALTADPFKGFGGLPVMIELRLQGTEEVIGVKRVVYGAIDPDGKHQNRNPQLTLVSADDEPIMRAWTVEPETEIVLLPRSSKESKESYLVKTFSGGSEELEEFLSYSFFATAGVLSHAKTGGRPSLFVTNKKVEDVTSKWTTPIETEPGKIWVVVRDDRGGIDWMEIPYDM